MRKSEKLLKSSSTSLIGERSPSVEGLSDSSSLVSNRVVILRKVNELCFKRFDLGYSLVISICFIVFVNSRKPAH